MTETNNNEIKTICVFCGSSAGRGKAYANHARRLGKAIADTGCSLVYGGSNIGLMRILADTVISLGEKVTGVMPNGLANKEIAHEGLHDFHLVDTMHERKALMASMSDAFIAMPGGIGTLDEIFEIMSWNQLDIISKPAALYNVEGYYDHLLKFLDHTVNEHFVRYEHRNNLLVDDDPQRLLNRIMNFAPHRPPSKWVDDLKIATNNLL
ncbi:MAG: TIGR00730 family Rossman fold protein [Bacteroidales bacterium]|nr:TIGR00730 family Rossman fold protein [Bacteroidales bacterium]MDZ4204258.1 TIGR00730 family Rossman fold protein [Bacteroidales bacterium]